MNYLLILEGAIGLLFTLITIGVNLFFAEHFSDFYFVLFAFGFGLICHAFGSAANLTNQFYTVTGSAALSLILLGTLHSLGIIGVSGPAQLSETRLEIHDVPITHTVSIKGSDLLFSRKEIESGEEASHEFILTQTLIKNSSLKVRICCDIDENNEQDDEEVYTISNTFIKEVINLNEDQNLRRELIGNNKYLFDSNNKSVAEERNNNTNIDFGNTGFGLNISPEQVLQNITIANNDTSLPIGVLLFSSYAQANENQAPLNALIERLSSQYSDLRRQARTDIASKGHTIVKSLMKRFHDQSSYRIKLGIIVALEEMVHLYPQHRTVIAKQIPDSKFQLLFQLSGDKDKTLRVRAATLITKLQDPRSTKFALSGFSHASLEGKRNRLLIIQQSIQKLPVAKQQTYVNRLKQLSASIPNNLRVLSNSILASISPNRSHDYAIVLGKFIDQTSAEKAAKEIKKQNSDLNISIGQLVNNNDKLPVIIGELPLKNSKQAAEQKASEIQNKFNSYVIDKSFITNQKSL